MIKRIKPIQWLLGFLVFAMVMALFAMTALTEFRRAMAQEKQSAGDQLTLLKSQIENVINSRLQSVQGIAAYVGTDPELTDDEFVAYILKLMPYGDPLIRNIGIIEDTTIKYVYPLKGNESAIGKDLSAIEGQKNQVIYVKDNLQSYMTAPVDLVQGGRGIIYRAPILIDDHNMNPQPVTNTLPPTPPRSYWGQLSLVFDYDKTIASITVSIVKSNLDLIITELDTEARTRRIIWARQDGKVIDDLTGKEFNNRILSQFGMSEPIIRTISTYHSEWTVYAQPPEGWKGDTSLFYEYLLLGLFFSIVSSAYFITLLSTRSELQFQVEQQTAQLVRMNNDMEQSVAEIEEKQAEMIELNDYLESSLQELKQTQEQLIVTEKYAALGELVAGVAHEINTPLGITVTMSTFLHEQHHKFYDDITSGNFKKSQLTEYNRQMDEGFDIMSKNLNRAATLVNSFKQVAVDQSTLELRGFNVSDYLNDVLHSLSPKFKHKNLQISMICPEELEISNYPGALSQIITNLVTNSILHGFPDDRSGNILLTVKKTPKGIEIIYEDDGMGIPAENITHVFDPFFTTKKNQGSTGLGMHIIYNLVTQTMAGSITLHSKPEEGVRFIIHIPNLTI